MFLTFYLFYFACSPSTISGAEDPVYHDQQTPLIPITPIEDEDAGADMCDNARVATIPKNSQPQLMVTGASSSRPSNTYLSTHTRPATEAVPGVGSDVLAALGTFLSTNNQGNLIDGSLLIKFLNDPKMVEQLVRNHAATSSSAQTIPLTTMPVTSMQTPPTSQQIARVSSLQNRARPVSQAAMSFSETVPISMSRPEQHFAHMMTTRPELGVTPVVAAAATSGGMYYPPPPSRVSSVPPNLRPMVPDVVLSAPTPSVGAPPVKDINYYKSLIQQHGGDRQETTVTQFGNRMNNHQQLGPSVRELPSNNPKPRDLKTKIMKPCIYFNSSRGCRNGANCAYQHDPLSQKRESGMPENPNAKRMKMDSSITGT